jgi:hemerythrin superfamily protein
MDAITLLEDDHESMRALLDDIEATDPSEHVVRGQLYVRLKEELTVHEIIEEEIFYPELKAHPKAREIVLEGIEEHNVVDSLLKEIDGLPVSDEKWNAKFTVMKENVEHHMEEEEGEMFKKARSVFDESELNELGERMEKRRSER